MKNLHLCMSRMSRLGHAKKGDFDPETKNWSIEPGSLEHMNNVRFATEFKKKKKRLKEILLKNRCPIFFS